MISFFNAASFNKEPQCVCNRTIIIMQNKRIPYIDNVDNTRCLEESQLSWRTVLQASSLLSLAKALFK